MPSASGYGSARDCPWHFVVLHLEIGDCRQQFGIPVDQAACPCRSALPCRADEDFQHGRDSPSSMVKRSRDQSHDAPSRLQLIEDHAAGLWSFHSQIFSTNASRPISRRMDRCARPAGARQPSGWRCRRGPYRAARARLAPHALVAAQDVLQRVVERVAHMQRAGDVRRRDHDTERNAPAASQASYRRASMSAGL
jgi:hypothetical protein